MEQVNKKRNFKNAFKCENCPGSSGEDGCPMWWSYIQKNLGSGEERLVSECGYMAMPQFLQATLAASNRPAEEIGMMRNEIVKGLTDIGRSIPKLIQQEPDHE